MAQGVLKVTLALTLQLCSSSFMDSFIVRSKLICAGDRTSLRLTQDCDKSL